MWLLKSGLINDNVTNLHNKILRHKYSMGKNHMEQIRGLESNSYTSFILSSILLI